VLTQNGEITHTWTDLNIVNWDVEVFQNPIQNEGCVNLYS
jgi:hypothetical protein